MAPRKKPTPPKTSEEEAPPSLPKWPPLKPLIPTSALSLTPLVPSQIMLVRNFWTSTLCRSYVAFLQTLPLVTTPGKPKKGEALRVNDRFSVEDWGFAERLWREAGLRELLAGGEDGTERDREDRRELWGGDVVGLNPMLRIYRYKKGQFFDCHYDESNVLSLPTSPEPTPARTSWTLLLYLTSSTTGCQGGQTVFYSEDLPHKPSPIEKEVVVELETGMLLLHKHGNDCMLHEGKEVTEGEKWVIRSDLCIQR